MTIATYHRVSTTDQDPALAREELRRAAHPVYEFEETGSGARNDRPQLQELMALVLARKVSHVFVWKLDRFGRSAFDVLANVQALQRAGCSFTATTQGLSVRPTGDAVSQLTLTILAAVAEFERELIRERTAAGIAKARANGVMLGRPPIPAATRREIHRLAAAGLSTRAIARRVSYVPNYGKHANKAIRPSAEAVRRVLLPQKGTPNNSASSEPKDTGTEG